MLDQILNNLNLTEKEKVLYKIILERGRILPSALAHVSKINRTTVYAVVNDLVQMGLVLEDISGKTMQYVPVNETELNKIIKQEKEKAEEKEKNVLALQKYIQELPQAENSPIPKLRFINEKDLKNYFYESLPRWYKTLSPQNHIQWGFQDHKLLEKYQKITDYAWEVAPKYMELRLFTNSNDFESLMQGKKYNKKRNLKFLKEHHFTATQYIIGEYVIYIMTKNKQDYLIEIHDELITSNTRELFSRLWEVL